MANTIKLYKPLSELSVYPLVKNTQNTQGCVTQGWVFCVFSLYLQRFFIQYDELLTIKKNVEQ
ncbi:hypothetical protein CIK98_01520 [Prevotella sp. P2-180]|nr:hypothetical protein CIK98_01520 [Prevotella sp. P2-180]